MEWLYGRNVVKAALGPGARRRAHRLAATSSALDGVAALVPEDLPVDTVAAHQLDELLGTREHQGVALQVDGYPYADPDRLLRGRRARRARRGHRPAQPGRRGAQRARRRRRRARGAQASLGARDAGRGQGVGRHARAPARGPGDQRGHLPAAGAGRRLLDLRRRRRGGGFVSSDRPHGADRHRRRRRGPGLRPLVARTCDALVSIPMEPRSRASTSAWPRRSSSTRRGGSEKPPRRVGGDGRAA